MTDPTDVLQEQIEVAQLSHDRAAGAAGLWAAVFLATRAADAGQGTRSRVRRWGDDQ